MHGTSHDWFIAPWHVTVYFIQGVVAISTSLAHNTSLVQLDVSNNDLVYGARDLVAVMSRNTTLKTLVLGATDLDEEFKKASPSGLNLLSHVC
jgi:hypothetical protein